MRLLFDVGALLAVLVLGYLLYLLLFERGAFYRVSGTVHEFDDQQRLRLLSTLLATPVQAIQTFAVLREGRELYEAQLEAIRSAQQSIHLEAYIFRPGTVADAFIAALRERALDGVRVRVVIDAIGSLGTGPTHFEQLLAAGASVHRYHSLHLRLLRRWNSRTHRNLLIIDGEVGFIGGAGIADYWNRSNPPPWRDCVLRVTGPIVAGLQAVFAENWLESAGELLVGADTFSDSDRWGQGWTETAVPGLAVGSTPTAGLSTRARMLVQFLLRVRGRASTCVHPISFPIWAFVGSCWPLVRGAFVCGCSPAARTATMASCDGLAADVTAHSSKQESRSPSIERE
jgi:cardiolipin synthase A/B